MRGQVREEGERGTHTVTSLPWLSRRGWAQRQTEKTACGTLSQGTPEEGRRGEEGQKEGGEERGRSQWYNALR